jgi:hypothetical protein
LDNKFLKYFLFSSLLDDPILNSIRTYLPVITKVYAHPLIPAPELNQWSFVGFTLENSSVSTINGNSCFQYSLRTPKRLGAFPLSLSAYFINNSSSSSNNGSSFLSLLKRYNLPPTPLNFSTKEEIC